MPTKPAKPKLDKRVVLTKKANVSTPEHSELLQWLIANHEYICGQYFYQDKEGASDFLVDGKPENRRPDKLSFGVSGGRSGFDMQERVLIS